MIVVLWIYTIICLVVTAFTLPRTMEDPGADSMVDLTAMVTFLGAIIGGLCLMGNYFA